MPPSPRMTAYAVSAPFRLQSTDKQGRQSLQDMTVDLTLRINSALLKKGTPAPLLQTALANSEMHIQGRLAAVLAKGENPFLSMEDVLDFGTELLVELNKRFGAGQELSFSRLDFHTTEHDAATAATLQVVNQPANA